MKYLGIAFLVVAAGCAGAQRRVEFTNQSDTSFVFMYLDMDDAPTRLGSAYLRQVAPSSEESFFSMRVDDGVLYLEKIPSGSYVLSSFGSGGGFYFFTRPTTYTLGRQGNPVRVTIDKPGVYFLGAYAYERTGRGWFQPDEFTLEPLEEIGEKELLGRILKHVRGSEWEARVQARYEAL